MGGYIVPYPLYYGYCYDRAERHDLKSRCLLFITLFFVPLFIGGKRKGEKNNQSRDFKSCLSARYTITIYIVVYKGSTTSKVIFKA